MGGQGGISDNGDDVSLEGEEVGAPSQYSPLVLSEKVLFSANTRLPILIKKTYEF